MSKHNYGDEDQNNLMGLIESYSEPDDDIGPNDEKKSNTEKKIAIQVLLKDRMIISDSADEELPF